MSASTNWVRLERLPISSGTAPVRRLSSAIEDLERGHAAQFRGVVRPFMLVLEYVQVGEFLQASQLRRDFPGEFILVKVDAPEFGEVPQQGWNLAVQALVG